LNGLVTQVIEMEKAFLVTKGKVQLLSDNSALKFFYSGVHDMWRLQLH